MLPLLLAGQEKSAQEQPACVVGSAQGPGLCVISPAPHS